MVQERIQVNGCWVKFKSVQQTHLIIINVNLCDEQQPENENSFLFRSVVLLTCHLSPNKLTDTVNENPRGPIHLEWRRKLKGVLITPRNFGVKFILNMQL